MKIAFIIEYFFPFNKGGSEWSTYYLARDLVEKGHEVTIITPNYGSQSLEIIDGIKIIRIPFYKKVKIFNSPPGNFFFTNPLFIIWSALFYFLYIWREKVQIIHVHGKYSIPPVRLANIALRKPILSTIRDYIPICNYGICLQEGNKSCDLAAYFKKDFNSYYSKYVHSKNPAIYIANIIFSIWGRASSKFLKFCSVNLRIIVLSKIQKTIFSASGFNNLEVIYNSFEFPQKIKVPQKKNLIVYAGRLTPGKGVDLLIDAIPNISKLYPSYQFIFAGEGFLKEKLIQASKKCRNIEILGNISHQNLLRLFSKAKIILAPSLWPEPFGRVALEALAGITPVIIGKRGGLAEEVDGKWGLAIDPTPQNIISAVQKLITQNEIFIKRIAKDYPKISHKFGSEVTSKYVAIYKELLG